MSNTSESYPMRYPEERFRSLYNNLLLRAVDAGGRWSGDDIRIKGDIIGQTLGLDPDDSIGYVEAHIFGFVRTLEILHVGTSQDQRSPRRFSTNERTWMRRMQAKTTKERVRAAYDDALTHRNNDRWNDWEMIVALEGIRDNIRLETDRPLYMMRLMRDLGMTERQGPSRAEAEDTLATLRRLIWFFRMYKVCEGSGERFPIWMHTEQATLYRRLTKALEDRLHRDARRCVGKKDVVESLCPYGRNGDHSLNEVQCLQLLRQWSWRVVQAAVLGNVMRYGIRRDWRAHVDLNAHGSGPDRDDSVTDAALVDLLRTLLDAIRENRADIDGQEVRIYQSLERELTRTIDAFVDAVVFGNDAYVEAIYRIQ